MNFLYSIHTSL